MSSQVTCRPTLSKAHTTRPCLFVVARSPNREPTHSLGKRTGRHPVCDFYFVVLAFQCLIRSDRSGRCAHVCHTAHSEAFPINVISLETNVFTRLDVILSTSLESIVTQLNAEILLMFTLFHVWSISRCIMLLDGFAASGISVG